MVMTPQMRQAIKILGMSTTDLHEFVDAALSQNPCLEKILQKSRAPHASSPSRDTFEYHAEAHRDKENPRDALISQLRMMGIDDDLLKIAEYLIYELDNNGYLTVSRHDVAEELSVPDDEVECALSLIQKLDPPGIGARDTAECLALQLARMGKGDSLESLIVNRFLTEVAREDYDTIAEALNTTVKEVRKAVTGIKKLQPRPAVNLFSNAAEWVKPDMIATTGQDGIVLEINKDWLPRLRLYNPYENKLDIVKDDKARAFLKENMNAAQELIDTLKRREETMCRVAEYILSYHRKEITDKNGELKGLSSKDIATALNLHVTTINRTIAHKYIQLDDKVVPLRSFISKAIMKANGESTSSIAIKKKIADLVKKENPQKPLSDKTIQKALAKDGIDIKRRTVAKYRNSLKILPTHLRKKATVSG